MTDDVIHSTPYYIKHINRAILANLQCRPLKVGRLIVLQKTHLHFKKIFFSHGNSLFSSPHPLDFNMHMFFSSKNVKQGHKLKLTNLYACWIMYMGWLEIPLTLGRSGTQYVAMVTKLFNSICGAHLVESHCKESHISDTNWLRYLFSSHLIKFG